LGSLGPGHSARTCTRSEPLLCWVDRDRTGLPGATETAGEVNCVNNAGGNGFEGQGFWLPRSFTICIHPYL
jgi:hypothetical protein